MMHPPTSSIHPPDTIPYASRHSYLDEDGYGFAPTPASTNNGGGKHTYYDPYAALSAGSDPSWVRAPDHPPPSTALDDYDLGQQRVQLLSAGLSGPAHHASNSEVGSSTSLGPDDSASVYRAAADRAEGDQQANYWPQSHLTYVPEEEPFAAQPLSYSDRVGLLREPFAGHHHHSQSQQQGYAHGGLSGETEDAWQGKGQRFGDLGRFPFPL